MKKHLIAVGVAAAALAATLQSMRPAQFASANPMAHTDGRTPIFVLPYAITASGSYVVAANLIGASGQDGITISADHVTVDLNGFSLKGSPGALAAIRMTGSRSGISIYGGTIRDWTAGIVGVTASSVQLSGLHVTGNSGIGVKLGDDAVVSGGSGSHLTQVALNAGNGIELGSNGVVRGVRVRSNGSTELVAGDGLALAECTIDAAGGQALVAGDRFEIRASTLGGSAALGSGGHAWGSTFQLEGTEMVTMTDENAVAECHFRRTNTSNAVPLMSLASSNWIDGNSFYQSDIKGMKGNCLADVGSDNQITSNHFVCVGGVAASSVIDLIGPRNVVACNSIHAALAPGSAGITGSSVANSIVENTIRGDGIAPIHGVRLLSNDNVVVSNTFGMLAAAPIDDQGSGNLKGPIVDDSTVDNATNPASQWRP